MKKKKKGKEEEEEEEQTRAKQARPQDRKLAGRQGSDMPDI